MISVKRLFSLDRIVAKQKVTVMFRGELFIGTVLHCDYKMDRYTIRVSGHHHHVAIITRRRCQIERIDDHEFEEVINDVIVTEDLVLN